MKKILFNGVGSAVPTPFDEKGVDISEFRKFLQFQIDNNIDALIVCGTTGESSTMTRDEKIIAINCALEVANEKIPVIVGTGSNNTREAIEMSKIAERLGVDGILVVTPYYNKTTQRGLIALYLRPYGYASVYGRWSGIGIAVGIKLLCKAITISCFW